MADITNAGATRDHGAAVNVRKGMELLAWRHRNKEWDRHIQARKRRRWLASLASKKPSTVPWGWITVASTFAAGLLVGAGLESRVVLGIAATGLCGTFVAYGFWRPRRYADAATPPEILFTSTGVIFGGHARRWRGYRYKLYEARLRSGELDELEPAYLELVFSSSWRETTLSIPVPSAFEQDAEELVARLEDMMLGRELGPARTDALAGDDLESRG